MNDVTEASSISAQARLKPRHLLFALIFLDPSSPAFENAAAAYRLVYPRARKASAETAGSRLLRNAQVAAFVAERRAKRVEQLELSAERTLRETARVAFLDPADIDPDGELGVKDLPEDARRAIASVKTRTETNEDGTIITTREVRFWSKPQALELLGKNQKLWADQLSVDLTVRNHADLLAEAYRRDADGKCTTCGKCHHASGASPASRDNQCAGTPLRATGSRAGRGEALT